MSIKYSKKLKPYIFTGGIFISLIFNFAFLTFNFASAQGLALPDPTGTGLAEGSLADTILAIINAALAFAGVVALIVIIYGGYIWMTSGGIPQRIVLAKKILLSAVFGFFFILVSWAIVNFVINGATGGGGGGPGGGGPDPLPGGGGSSSLTVKWTDPKDGDSDIPLCRIFQAGFNRNISTGTVNSANVTIKMSCDMTHPCDPVFGGQNLGSCTDPYGTLDYCTGNIAGLPGVSWTYFDALNNDDPGPPLPDAFEFSPPTEWETDRTYWVNLNTNITNSAGDLNLSGKRDYVFSVGNTTDNIAPQVSAIYPGDGDINVCRLKPISVQFSEPMRASSLKDLSTLSVTDADYASFEISLSDGSIQPADLTFGAFIPDPLSAVYSPKKPYEKNTTYYPILRAGEDLDGDKTLDAGEDKNGNGQLDGIQDACRNSLDQTPDAPYGSPFGDYGDAQGDPDDAPVDYSFTTDNADDIQCDPQIDSVSTAPFYYDPPSILTGNTGEIVIQGRNFGATGEVNLPNGIVVNNAINSCLDQTIAPPNEYTNTGRLCRVSWADNQIVIIAPAEGGLSNGAVDGPLWVNLGGTGVCDLGATNQCLAGPNKGQTCASNDECPINVSNKSNIDIASPHISFQSPNQGPKGQPITLAGTDFGDGDNDAGDDDSDDDAVDGIIRFIRQSDREVVNGTFPCNAISWTVNRIIVEFPIDTGTVTVNTGDVFDVQVERTDGRNSNFGTFEITAGAPGPVMCSLAPDCGLTGTSVIIGGKRFGTAGTVSFGSAFATVIPSWADTQITAASPTQSADGTYPVKVIAGGDSNTLPFSTICSGRPRVVESATCTTGTQSPSPYKNITGIPDATNDACVNTSAISARFNMDMLESEFSIGGNTLLYRCSSYNSSCITAVGFSSLQVINQDTPNEGFIYTPNIGPNWPVPDAWYQFVINGNNIKSEAGVPMQTWYRWNFHMANSAEKCPLNSLNVSPASISVPDGTIVSYKSVAQSSNCNFIGSCDEYAYNWSTAGGHSSVVGAPNTCDAQISADSATTGTPDVVTATANTISDTGDLTVTDCGNGIREGTEQCDDGDNIDANACSNICRSNSGSGSLLPRVVEQNSCLLDTQSPSPYRNQTDSCSNTAIGARFNKDMDDGTLIKANMRLENCGADSACSAPVNVDINPPIWLFGFATWGSGGEEGIALQPPAPLNADTYYRVTLSANLAASGYGLDGNKNGVQNGSPADDYSWIFKTSNDSCAVKSISTSPANMSVAVSSSKPISAIPQAENCNVLNASDFNWEWTEADNAIATVTKTVAPNQSVLGVKAGATIVSAKITNPEAAAVPAGTSNITVTNTLSCNDLGLTAVWKFDEDSGSVALDSGSSGANDGLLTSDSVRVSNGCRFGKCINLNGTDQYAAVNPALLNFGTGDFTAEGWIKTGVSVNSQTIISKQYSGDQPGYTLDITPVGVAFFRVNPLGIPTPDRQVQGAKLVNNSQWHHIAGAREGNTIRLYVDGNLESSSTSGSTANVDSIYSTLIGAYGDPTNLPSMQSFTKGMVDEVRVWNKALDISEIRSIYNQACMLIDTISCSDPNLKAVWKLDENSGIVANDSTANNNDGQLNNNPTWESADCKFGKCLRFDGNDDHIKIPDSDSISMTSAITMEAWIKTNEQTQRYIFSKHDASGVPEEYEYTLLLDPGGIIRAEFRKGPLIADYITALGTSNVADNNWHHIAATFNGSNINIYNNGILESTTSWANNISSAVAKYLFIGQLGDDGSYFNGSIDEPRIWDKALTQEEIVSAMSQSCLAGGTGAILQCTNDVAGLWNFDEGNGTLAADGSRNKNNGILMNSPAWNTTGCQFGNCLNLDGTDDYIDLANPPALNFGDGINDKPFTISAWIKRSNLTADNIIVSKYNSQANPYRQQYIFNIDAAGRLVIAIFDTVDPLNNNLDQRRGILTSTQPLNNLNWHYVAATYNGSKTNAGLKLYVDGIEQATTVLYDELTFPNYVAMDATSESVKIGRNTDAGGAGNYFPGTIDEVRIYNRALSATEIANTYQKSMTQCVEATLYCSNPELTAVWKMDEGIGVVAGDSTKNNLDGALGISSQNPAWIEAGCYIGKCLDFNAGEGDYVAVPDNPKLNFGANSFTIEGWVKYTATARERIISKYSANNGYDLVTDNGQIQFNVCEGGVCDSVTSGATAANTGGWVHIAAVRDRPASELRLYVGGWPQGTAADNGKSASYAGSLYLGREQDTPYYYFSGIMDEFRIWNKALSDNEVQSASNQQCLSPQKGSACDLDLAAPMCQPNVGLCESGDPDLRCSIKSCTCQEAFTVNPPPVFTYDSEGVVGGLACRNTAITVDFNEPIDVGTIKTAKTTVTDGNIIFQENFDGADASPIGLVGWTTDALLNESPHWDPWGPGTSPVWTRNSNSLYEQSNSGSGLFITSNSITRTDGTSPGTNYRISFDAGVFIGTEAAGFVFGYTDDKNYYELLWSDPQDEYASLLPTRLVLQKKVNGTFIDLAGKNNFITSINTMTNFIIEVRGTNIIVSSGGQTLLSYNDSLSGVILLNKVGFYTHDNDGGVAYDNLIIKDTTVANVPGTVDLYAFQPATANLLADGDMERTTTDVWKTYETVKTVEKSTTIRHGGNRSLHVVTDDHPGNREGVTTLIGVVNIGDHVRVNGWAFSSNGSVDIELTNSLIVGPFVATNSGAPSSGWKEFAIEADSPLTGNLFLTLYSPAQNLNEFYVDDISVAIEHNLAVDISTRVSGSQLTISPRQYLDPNRNYVLNLHGAVASSVDLNGPYEYDPANIIRAVSGTPLETDDGIYDWNFNTGTEICKIGKAEIEFTKNTSTGNVSYKSPDLFICAGDSCSDDFDAVAAGDNHGVAVIPYSVNGGILAGPMDYKWTPSADAPFSINFDDIPLIEATSKPTNGQGTLTAQVDQLDGGGDVIGAAKAIANITVNLCENPWIGDQASVPWTENSTNFSTWYCRDAGAMQDLTDDLPNLTVQEVTMPPPIGPTPLAEYLYYDAGNVSDALGIRVYANPSSLPLSEWLDQNANVSGGQSGMFNGWQSVRAGRSLYVSAMNDVPLGLYNNIYLISYSDKASSTLIGIYNQIISNWKFMVNNISDTDIAKLQRDIRRIDDLGKISTALYNYKTKNGAYPKLDAGTYLPGMSTSVWPSWQASFGNALQTSIPKDPINSLGNLIGYWKFDEGTGITANDSSAEGNNGRLVNNPVWKSGADCKVGNCLEMDNANDYVQMSASNSASGSVELWTKPGASQNGNHILTFGNGYGTNLDKARLMVDGAGNYEFGFWQMGGACSNWQSIGSGISAAENVFTHLVGAWDSNGMKFYVNGKFVGENTNCASGITNNPTEITIGDNTYGTANYNGYIDELRVYNRALSGSEIALLAGGGFSEATGWNQDTNSFRCDAGTDFDSHIYHYQYKSSIDFDLYAALEYVGPNWPPRHTWRQTTTAAPFPQPATSYSCYNYTPAVHGNGVPELPETCDDGNVVSGDGCSSVGVVE